MFKIGNVTVPDGAILAPMAGITDRTYRKICKSFGCALTVSEMISAKGVYYGDKKTVTLADSSENENPYSLQIFGSEPEIMAIAAQKLLEINPKINIFDINMGCPMPKITNNGEGSALMKNPQLAGRVVRAVVDAVSVPVSVKMRIGWDKNSINAVYFAQVLEANGASAICVHGRTREQLYAPPVLYNVIRDVKSAVKIPVIANGGIYSGEDAIALLDRTGCEAVAIGQGAMGNPFIFEECLMAFRNQPYVAPVSEEILKIAAEHVRLLCKDKGDYIGVREARKHLGWYIKGMPGATEARRKINASESVDELLSILDTLKNT